jgi:hypothetical protein
MVESRYAKGLALSGVVAAMAVFASPARGFDRAKEERGRTYILEGKQFFAEHFLCLRLGATDAQNTFVVKPQPPYTREEALATLHNAGLPGTVEIRSRVSYGREIHALARVIARHQAARFRAARVRAQPAWTPGENCPSVYIHVEPPGHFAASAWAERVAARYGPDRVKATRSITTRRL